MIIYPQCHCLTYSRICSSLYHKVRFSLLHINAFVFKKFEIFGQTLLQCSSLCRVKLLSIKANTSGHQSQKYYDIFYDSSHRLQLHSFRNKKRCVATVLEKVADCCRRNVGKLLSSRNDDSLDLRRKLTVCICN